jgi:hypothetical protein
VGRVRDLVAFYAPDVTTYPAAGGAYPERACVGCSPATVGPPTYC